MTNEHFVLMSGKEAPLGASVRDGGCNFSVWAPEATKVTLILYTEDEKEIVRYDLPEKHDGLWFGFVANVKPGQLYAYSVDGRNEPKNGLSFDATKILIDPYAKKINRPIDWNYELYLNDSGKMISKSVIVDDTSFDWQGVKKPGLTKPGTILYETHVKGFTKLRADIPEEYRGTFLGLCQPSVIKYLKELGITAVQLMPVFAKMSESRLIDMGLSNYWGYNPMCFFAPEPGYARSDAVNEFKTMVRELHRAGIGVIMDVVYNHTAEGGHGGPNISFRGFDSRNYYVYEFNEDKSVNYLATTNVTGCGNSFNSSSEPGLRIILDSMRYWLTEMQVDGFRFDLAVTVARETTPYVFNSFETHGTFFKACHADPIISQAILIGEPWDVGGFGYRVGQFPSQWSEQNDRYRDTVRSFWRGDQGKMGELATRLLGSRDLYPKNIRSINTSVNFVSYHDGFTLEDVVSYNDRHNEANGEHNRDGSGNNVSYNWGEEGPTKNPSILRRRNQVKRNMMATLLLSQGIPHFVAGDEIGRTQGGNNNAYCQDNEISYVHWDLNQAQQNFRDFVSLLTRIRTSSKVFTDLQLDGDNFRIQKGVKHDVDWYHPSGQPLEDSDWASPVSQAFMLDIGEHREGGERYIILFNASRYDICFHLPEPDEDMAWSAVMDTAEENGIPDRYGDRKGLIPVCCSLCMKLLKQVDRELVSGSCRALGAAINAGEEEHLHVHGVSVSRRMIESVAQTVSGHYRELGNVLPKGILSTLTRRANVKK
ncbi:glycogen debranching protein GlgX [Ruminobacter sp.]|uniref:glycogen debranching protein GlgX n=1 Tax=Ruminobacter sp. TaxID=2774296 RepID=UPI0025FE3B17|nr:glycogen debranching protein GlgX [Ruminobacter sp.]